MIKDFFGSLLIMVGSTLFGLNLPVIDQATAGAIKCLMPAFLLYGTWVLLSNHGKEGPARGGTSVKYETFTTYSFPEMKKARAAQQSKRQSNNPR